MIGLVTDSNSQLPTELARRYGIAVVPLTVTVDGVDHLEGVDLDADGFWARFRSATPSVATSQPSPGRFADAYRALAEQGAHEILSVHIGLKVSGTVNSARLAAESAPVPVRVVDTGTASFAVACCTWEAAEAVAAGATLDEAAAVAEGVAATVGMVFVVSALDLARAGGRLAVAGGGSGGGADRGPDAPTGTVPVLTMVDGVMDVIDHAAGLDEAADAMATRVRSAPGRLRVGIGVADPGAEPLARAVVERLAHAPQVVDLVRYRVGPSVGAHTGPGTVGAVYYPPLGSR